MFCLKIFRRQVSLTPSSITMGVKVWVQPNFYEEPEIYYLEFSNMHSGSSNLYIG